MLNCHRHGSTLDFSLQVCIMRNMNIAEHGASGSVPPPAPSADPVIPVADQARRKLRRKERAERRRLARAARRKNRLALDGFGDVLASALVIQDLKGGAATEEIAKLSGHPPEFVEKVMRCFCPGGPS